MNMHSTSTQPRPLFSRTEYGEIIDPRRSQVSWGFNYSQYASDLYAETCHLIKLAVIAEKIPEAYDTISWDKRHRASGSAIHHEIYDISEDARHILLCVRQTQGSKYGVRTTSKTYYIISTHGKGVRVVETSKAKAAKAAKQAINLGDAIAVCQGKKKLASPRAGSATNIYYKIVAAESESESNFVSVFDGTPWPVGRARIQKSTPNHSGGFYVFPTIADALSAWEKRRAFAEGWLTHRHYALLACECSGRRFLHDGKKICITKVKPVEVVAGLIA